MQEIHRNRPEKKSIPSYPDGQMLNSLASSNEAHDREKLLTEFLPVLERRVRLFRKKYDAEDIPAEEFMSAATLATNEAANTYAPDGSVDFLNHTTQFVRPALLEVLWEHRNNFEYKSHGVFPKSDFHKRKTVPLDSLPRRKYGRAMRASNRFDNMEPVGSLDLADLTTEELRAFIDELYPPALLGEGTHDYNAKKRESILAYFGIGQQAKTQAEIATQYGVSPTTVQQYLEEFKKKAKATFERRDFLRGTYTD